MRIVTDSTPVEDPKDPSKDNVFALYALLATPEERDVLAGRYRAGGLGYGDAKKLLIEKIDERLRPEPCGLGWSPGARSAADRSSGKEPGGRSVEAERSAARLARNLRVSRRDVDCGCAERLQTMREASPDGGIGVGAAPGFPG